MGWCSLRYKNIYRKWLLHWVTILTSLKNVQTLGQFWKPLYIWTSWWPVWTIHFYRSYEIWILHIIYSWSHAKQSTSSISISSNSVRPTSSTSDVFKAAWSYRPGPQADFMITSSSNTLGPKRARRSVAICLLPENIRSQGTEEAWEGRTSRAIRARVGYSCAWSLLRTVQGKGRKERGFN